MPPTRVVPGKFMDASAGNHNTAVHSSTIPYRLSFSFPAGLFLSFCCSFDKSLSPAVPQRCRSAVKHRLSLSCGKVGASKLVVFRWKLIRAGTDQSQGRGQVVSNINACLAVQSTIKGTLGPYGGDLLMVDENGRQTITNDGATVMKVATAPKL